MKLWNKFKKLFYFSGRGRDKIVKDKNAIIINKNNKMYIETIMVQFFPTKSEVKYLYLTKEFNEVAFMGSTNMEFYNEKEPNG